MSGFFGRAGRGLLFFVHLAMLIAGVFIAIMALQSFADNFGRDSTEIALSRLATPAVLISVVLAFVMILQWRGFSVEAPFLFLLSYISIGAAVSGNGRAMAKHFGAAPPEALTSLYLTSGAQILLVALMALGAWALTYQRSRFPLI